MWDPFARGAASAGCPAPARGSDHRPSLLRPWRLPRPPGSLGVTFRCASPSSEQWSLSVEGARSCGPRRRGGYDRNDTTTRHRPAAPEGLACLGWLAASNRPGTPRHRASLQRRDVVGAGGHDGRRRTEPPLLPPVPALSRRSLRRPGPRDLAFRHGPDLRLIGTADLVVDGVVKHFEAYEVASEYRTVFTATGESGGFRETDITTRASAVPPSMRSGSYAWAKR